LVSPPDAEKQKDRRAVKQKKNPARCGHVKKKKRQTEKSRFRMGGKL